MSVICCSFMYSNVNNNKKLRVANLPNSKRQNFSPKKSRKKSVASAGLCPQTPCLGKIPTHVTPMYICFTLMSTTKFPREKNTHQMFS